MPAHVSDASEYSLLGIPSHRPFTRSSRFFETEGIAILTMLISRYKVEVKEEPQFAAETFEERKARVFAAKPGLTLTSVTDML